MRVVIAAAAIRQHLGRASAANVRNAGPQCIASPSDLAIEQGRSRRSGSSIFECPSRLFWPSLPRQKTRIIQADRRRLAPAGQALQHLRRKISQPQLAADMAFGQTDGFGQFLDRGELTGLHAPPPAPCPAYGAQNMRVLCLVFAGLIVGGRQDFWSTVLLADLQRDQHADRVIGLRHSAASRLARRDHLADDACDPLAPDVDLEPRGGDGDAPDEKLDDPCLLGREQLRPERAELMQVPRWRRPPKLRLFLFFRAAITCVTTSGVCRMRRTSVTTASSTIPAASRIGAVSSPVSRFRMTSIDT